MLLKKETVGYYGAIVNLSIHALFSLVAAVEEQQRERGTQEIIMDASLKLSFQAFYHDKPICAAVQGSNGLLDGFDRARTTMFRLIDDLIDDLFRTGERIPQDFINTFYPALCKRVAQQFRIELPGMPFITVQQERELMAA